MGADRYIAVWQNVCERFKQGQGEAVYNSWLKPLTVSHIESGVLYLNSPSKFIKNWVNNNYKAKINLYLSSVDSSIYTIDIAADETKPVLNNDSSQANQNTKLELKNSGSEAKAEAKQEFTSYFDKRYKFSNYIVGEANKVAYTVATRAVSGAFNPLVITGGVGRGKTHLMHAMANDISEKDPNKKIVCLSSEKFMFMFIKALKQNNIVEFKDYVRSADVLLMDDIQFIAGKQNIAEEFLHTYDYVTSNGGAVVVTCAEHPHNYEKLDERIKSRLSSGMVCAIDMPDRELRLNLFKDKFSKLNFNLDDEAIAYLADKVTGNVRDIDGAINRLVAQSYILNTAIDYEFLKRFFAGSNMYEAKKIITIEQIKRKTSEYFNVKTTDLDSDKKTRQISRPRQVAMYLCKKLTQHGTSEIGRNFGNKDHSTVVNACRTVEDNIKKNEQFASLVIDIERAFK